MTQRNERDRRVQLPQRISVEARDGFNKFAAEHDVTLTTLFEVVGLAMARGEFDVTDIGRAFIEQARRLDGARRKRTPDVP